MQFDNNFCIQFSEINEKAFSSNNKKETHLAFSSKNPKQDIIKIENWFKNNKNLCLISSSQQNYRFEHRAKLNISSQYRNNQRWLSI
jgi:hypothetical protein